MTITIRSKEFSFKITDENIISSLAEYFQLHTKKNELPLRFSVVQQSKKNLQIEIESIVNCHQKFPSIFEYRQRKIARTAQFNAVMLIPTGIDCEIGGHAGDATPSARLLATQCDHLIIHPNVVNASDINEMTDNCLYAEGSLVTRLLMGQIGLKKVRQNRILLITEKNPEYKLALNKTINCVEGARATLGIDIADILILEKGLHMETGISKSGRVTGAIDHIERLLDLLENHKKSYDAIAITSKITLNNDAEKKKAYDYFTKKNIPNIWGSVEAILTHFISSYFNVPSAHAPTLEDDETLLKEYGIIDPRKGAEIISSTYLFCVLKGLNRAPQLMLNCPDYYYDPSVLTVEDVSCLVIPDGCIGLPTLAALQQGIPVIAVKNNKNLMRNKLEDLPFQSGQLRFAENYYEAAGMMAAIKAGVATTALERPIPFSPIHHVK